MKNLIIAITFCLLTFSCGKDGKVIEVKEVSAGKFSVVSEREDDNSYVIVKYLNGAVKTMTFDQAEQFIASNPPSPVSSPVFQNYENHQNTGITLSDLFLYNMMFGGFGGNHYQSRIIEHYPTYYTTINTTNSTRRTKQSDFNSSASNGWSNSSAAKQPVSKSNYSSKASSGWSNSSASKQPVAKSSYSSRPSSGWGNSSSRSYSKPSSFGSRSSSSGASSSRKSSFSSRKR